MPSHRELSGLWRFIEWMDMEGYIWYICVRMVEIKLNSSAKAVLDVVARAWNHINTVKVPRLRQRRNWFWSQDRNNFYIIIWLSPPILVYRAKDLGLCLLQIWKEIDFRLQIGNPGGQTSKPSQELLCSISLWIQHLFGTEISCFFCPSDKPIRQDKCNRLRASWKILMLKLKPTHSSVAQVKQLCGWNLYNGKYN